MVTTATSSYVVHIPVLFYCQKKNNNKNLSITHLKTNRFVLLKLPLFFTDIYYCSESDCWDNPTLEIFQWFHQRGICILPDLTCNIATEILCSVMCGCIWPYAMKIPCVGREKRGFKWLSHYLA